MTAHRSIIGDIKPETRICRIFLQMRFFNLFDEKENGLLRPKKWDERFEKVFLQSPAALSSGETRGWGRGVLVLRRAPPILALLIVPAFLGLDSAPLVFSEANAAEPAASSDSRSVLEPSRYRGRYVPPAGLGAGPDPFAPGPNSPYWRRLEMTDPEGRKTFPPGLVEVASQLRFEQRNPALGLGLSIDLDMHPQPFMTVNEKIYPVKFNVSGWRKVAYVTADVGTRQFENVWFAAFAGQSAVVSGLPSTSAVPGFSAAFRVDEATFGPSQITVVHDGGRTTSRAGYVGSLTLRETFGSFIEREWGLARQQSFVLVFGALIGAVVVALIGCVISLTRKFLRHQRRHRAVSVPPASGSVPRPRPRQARKRRKKTR